MRGAVWVLLWMGMVSACGGKAAGDGDATSTGGSTATGGATSTGGTSATGGITASGGVASMATGGRQSSGDWAASCPDGGDSLRFRRLTVSDINATLADVFGGPATPLGGSWPTRRLGPRGSSDPEQLRRLVEIAQERGLEYAQAHADDCADEAQCETQIRGLGLRLFRRPLAEAEVASFLELFRAVAANSGEQGGLAAVVEALIESPYFAFRIDTTVSTSDGLRWTPHSVAARLAYFLWRSGPDAQLLDAASSSEWLESRDVLAQQTRRMLEDPRAQEGFAALVREWLELPGTVSAVQGVPVEEMSVQTGEFLGALFTGGSPSLAGLLLGNHASLNATLADYYGVRSDGLGQGFSDVELDPARFSGILTHGSLLMAHPVPSSRGSLLLRKLLCQELASPPSSEMLPEQGSTRRERFEAISATTVCRACHVYLDPLGFALEGFDSLAAPQDVATNGSIQELDGVTTVEFDGPRELAELLAASEQVSHCTVRHFLEYALDGGHGSRQILLQAQPPGPGEPPKRPAPVECLASAFAPESGDLRSLLLGLPMSGVFQSAEVAFELTPEMLGATGSTPLEHAAANAALLSRFIANQTLAEMADIRSYAEALVMLAEEAP
jgi:hypothetical protein